VKVRFLADADLNKVIVSGVLRREPSLDFLTAQAAGLRGMRDPEVLALAAGQQRVLVSHDVGTMPAHFRAFRRAGKRSSGVFLIPQNLDVAAAIDELLLIWLASEAADWEDRLEWLPL
jgi:predicted nuclease of predicted toxin-antitoxin system